MLANRRPICLKSPNFFFQNYGAALSCKRLNVDTPQGAIFNHPMDGCDNDFTRRGCTMVITTTDGVPPSPSAEGVGGVVIVHNQIFHQNPDIRRGSGGFWSLAGWPECGRIGESVVSFFFFAWVSNGILLYCLGNSAKAFKSMTWGLLGGESKKSIKIGISVKFQQHFQV